MKNNRPTYKNIPKDQDTISSVGREVGLGAYQAVHQYFRWEGVDGESLIFETKGLSLDHQELKELVEASNFYDSERDSGITISADKSFTFVNFNFVLKED